MAARAANVFTIPAGAPFLPTLADAVLSGRLGPIDRSDPLSLADVTILLPTRRAVRALRDLMAARLGADAAILPAIRPIGDVDEEDHLLGPAAETAADRLALPPAISRLARQLALTRLTLAWGRAVRREVLSLGPDEVLHIPASAADAARLADDLARLMDDMATAGVDPGRIAALAPDDHAQYFQVTLDFLKIAFEAWPATLAGMGMVDPALRRDRLIRGEAERLAAGGARGPVVAAGSTGSIPATAELLRVIAGLPEGAVVLPGLDTDLDDAAWSAIGDRDAAARAYSHPQFGLKRLVADIGSARSDVVSLAAVPEALGRRARIVSEALRPAETTDAWAAWRGEAADERALEAALAGVSLIVGHNEQEEALAIAIAIRQAVEEGLATVAVVTPDRTIARRVSAELGRWGLGIDDSGGARLDLLPAGVFARLLADAVASGGDPARLLAFLKHPFAAFGMDPVECRRAARMLELALFRGRRVAGGIAGLEDALAAARAAVEEPAARHLPAARRRMNPGDWSLAARLVRRVASVLAPLESAFASGGEVGAGGTALLLRDALREAATDHGRRDDVLWSARDGGAALAELLDGIAGDRDLAMRAEEFPAFLGTLMGSVVVARPAGADPRIHIWGTLEARLQSADLLILAGLDEGVWPAESGTDPWLSRAMRAEIGLPPPERRVGLAAHDFVQALAGPRVVVTRAARRGGSPTVASRWLQRFEALVGARPFERLRTRGDVHVGLARDIDRATGAVRPVPRPEPKPLLAARPRSLSVTEIETLIRDPYAVYAKHVLRLEELDPLGQAPDYALRGTLIHDALGTFIAGWQGRFDAAAEAALLAAGRESLREIEAFPDIHAIWSIRFAGIARWLVAFEAGRDGAIAERHAELSGRHEIAAPAGPFILRGRADRIDRRHDGRVDILDFKTGSPPSAKQVLVGLAPQLALEAAMVRAGAFGAEFAGLSIDTLAWIALGRVERGQPVVSAVERDFTADAVGGMAADRLAELVAAFDDPERGYASRARPMFETRYESPYDHLARVREWALVESDEDLLWSQGFPPPPVRP